MIDLSNWMASVHESRWHIIQTEGGSPLALCNHRVRGPVRRVISETPPEMNDARGHCPNCLHIAAEIREGIEPPTVRKPAIQAALEITEGLISWPTEDPDREMKKVPGSPYLPGTEREPTALAA